MILTWFEKKTFNRSTNVLSITRSKRMRYSTRDIFYWIMKRRCLHSNLLSYENYDKYIVSFFYYWNASHRENKLVTTTRFRLILSMVVVDIIRIHTHTHIFIYVCLVFEWKNKREQFPIYLVNPTTLFIGRRIFRLL